MIILVGSIDVVIINEGIEIISIWIHIGISFGVKFIDFDPIYISSLEK